MFYFLGGSCKYGWYSDFQCPETNKCVSKYTICDGSSDGYYDCGDGSDELHCNGKCQKVRHAICTAAMQFHNTDCGDGSDELYCNGNCFKILSSI